MKQIKILIVAGEASSDLHASLVIERLQQQAKVTLLGIGGDRLCKLGLQPLAHAKDMAVVGLWEAVKHIPKSLKLISSLAKLAAQEKPDLALLLDLPDFNLRLAPKLKRIGIPVLYFISPQVWAWRSGRVEQMAKNIDKLLCILPFEKPWFEQHAPKELHVQYVGHPAIEEIPALQYQPDENMIALLPGSRKSEWELNLEEMLRAASLLRQNKPALRFIIPLAEPLRDDQLISQLFNQVLKKYSLENAVTLKAEPAYTILAKAKLAIVVSGTATLETAIVGTPMIVVYRVAWLSAFLFKNLIAYKGPIAMVNLVHRGLGTKEFLVPELVQDAMTAEHIAKTAMQYLTAAKLWQNQAQELQKTRTLLQTKAPPSDAVVQEIMQFAGNRI